MKIVKDPEKNLSDFNGAGKIEISELKEMAKNMIPQLVKAMVDIEKGIMAVDGGFHADLMEFLISEEKSKPENLWGINIYPGEGGDNFVEFDSVMNLRPASGNKTRGVDDEEKKNKIIAIVNKLVQK